MIFQLWIHAELLKTGYFLPCVLLIYLWLASQAIFQVPMLKIWVYNFLVWFFVHFWRWLLHCPVSRCLEVDYFPMISWRLSLEAYLMGLYFLLLVLGESGLGIEILMPSVYQLLLRYLFHLYLYWLLAPPSFYLQILVMLLVPPLQKRLQSSCSIFLLSPDCHLYSYHQVAQTGQCLIWSSFWSVRSSRRVYCQFLSWRLNPFHSYIWIYVTLLSHYFLLFCDLGRICYVSIFAILYVFSLLLPCIDDLHTGF